MTLLEHLQAINPNFLKFVIQDIQDANALSIGVRCFGIEKDGTTFSGGTASTSEIAKRIAIAEAFERSLIDVVAKDEKLSKKFNMAYFPSSSGFASGFDRASTRFRAICEGLERWVWSKWIDEQYRLSPHPKNEVILNPLAAHLSSSFDEVFWYSKNFLLPITLEENLPLTIIIFLGCKDNGIYPGSRVSRSTDDLYTHPIIEAQRNYSNTQLNKVALPDDDIIKKRTFYFANNKKQAFEQILKANIDSWPEPKLRLLEELDTNITEVFLYRCLLENFMGWHLGPVNRFVY